jgi:enamine deaminase RidA (YjgF/YER057c/UK114 family)
LASVEQARGGRRVSGVIDAGGVYGARLAAAGNYVFMASTAAGPSGGIPAEAIPPPPYQTSESAHVRAQTRYLFERYREGLEELGSSIDDIVQLEQYVLLKAHANGYAQSRTHRARR